MRRAEDCSRYGLGQVVSTRTGDGTVAQWTVRWHSGLWLDGRAARGGDENESSKFMECLVPLSMLSLCVCRLKIRRLGGGLHSPWGAASEMLAPCYRGVACMHVLHV
jgi:hypothetical protein